MLAAFILTVAIGTGQAPAPAPSPSPIPLPVPTPAPTPEPYRFDYLRIKDRIEADGSSRRAIETSVLLRTAASVLQFGQIGATYVVGFGSVEFENVRVQKPSGVWSDVKDGQVEDLDLFAAGNTPIDADIRFKRMTVPGLEPGDRIAYTLTASQKALAPGQAFGDMKFGPLAMDTPQVYELDVPKALALTVRLRDGLGTSWEAVPGGDDRLIRRLKLTVPPKATSAKDLTAADTERLQTPDVSFTTFPTWAQVGQWWLESSRDRLKADDAIKQAAERIAAPLTTPRAKVEALASFLNTRLANLDVGFSKGRMQPRAAAAVLSSGYGDAKDKVGLLIAMASAVGVEVRPVLLQTLRGELTQDAPGPHQFDHLVAAAILGPAEKDWVWIDVTSPWSAPTTLRPSMRDKPALSIDSKGAGVLVRTPVLPPVPSRKSVVLTGALEATGRLKGRIRIEDRSDNEAGLRASFAAAQPEQHAEMLRSALSRTWKIAGISAVRTANPRDLSAPFWLEFDFRRIVPEISPEKEWRFWIPDIGPALQEGTIDTTARKPVVFDVGDVAFTATVELPEDLTARPPKAVTIDKPFATLAASYSVKGRTLSVNRVMRLLAPAITHEQMEEYEAFRKAAAADREEDFVLGPMKVVPLPPPAPPKVP